MLDIFGEVGAAAVILKVLEWEVKDQSASNTQLIQALINSDFLRAVHYVITLSNWL